MLLIHATSENRAWKMNDMGIESPETIDAIISALERAGAK